MFFALICKDKPDSLDLRLSTRAAHLDYLNELNDAGKLKFAGPLLDDAGKSHGSLVVVEAGDRTAAEEIAAGDPYAKAGLFESVEIHGWNWVFNAPQTTQEVN